MEAKLNSYFTQTALDSSPIASLIRSPRPIPALEDAIAPCHGEWLISQDLARLLANIVLQQKPQNILEFGAGSSSRIFARSLSMIGGGALTSLEQNPPWCREAWQEVLSIDRVDAMMIPTVTQFSIGVTGFHYAFKGQRQAVGKRGPYDLVFIDSPQYFFGREGAMSLIYPQIQPGALILLDDSARLGEQRAIYQWLNSYPGLQPIYFNPDFGDHKGLTILRMGQCIPPRLSLASLFTNLQQLNYLFLKCPDFWDKRKAEGAGQDH
ncbi:MAG: class I SAM-dependent methyltransferase [Acaryochloridaceae cyanobacterium RL_2_7]|nr:class I SAM-dependent methyltransferase [Acaryochloridaceae cyanobacterium RL_2_7]